MTKTFNVWKLEREETDEIKGLISTSSLIPVYSINQVIVNACTKFLHRITDLKEGKAKSSIASFAKRGYNNI